MILLCMYRLGGSKMDLNKIVVNDFNRNPILLLLKEFNKNIKFLCRTTKRRETTIELTKHQVVHDWKCILKLKIVVTK